jgi:hypothetical protein
LAALGTPRQRSVTLRLEVSSLGTAERTLSCITAVTRK